MSCISYGCVCPFPCSFVHSCISNEQFPVFTIAGVKMTATETMLRHTVSLLRSRSEGMLIDFNEDEMPNKFSGNKFNLHSK